MAVDFISSIPWDLVTGQPDADAAGMLRGFRLVRLWRRARAGTGGGTGGTFLMPAQGRHSGPHPPNTLPASLPNPAGTFLRVAYIIFGWILAAHVCACIFFAV